MKKKLLCLILFVVTASLFSVAQNQICKCCTDQHNEFDFWVGDWVVYDTIGNRLGENQVLRIENNCLITEKWSGIKGSSGRSMNYFEPNDSTWNQLWVSSTGNNLLLKGKLTDGNMVLESDLVYHPKQTYYNRITWTPKDNGTVIQIWDLFDESGQFLKSIFHGVYIPKKREINLNN